MEQTYLQIRGERVPALGFGTAGLTGQACVEAVRDALEIGYRHIDTARVYANEAEVGQGIRDSGVGREEVFLTTKIVGPDLEADRVGAATDERLRLLGVDQIDLLLIHGPSQDVPLKVTLDAMNEQKVAGKVRHIGVSNFRTALLAEAMAHCAIFTNQVPYQPGRTQRGLCEVARTQDIMLTAYSPLRGKGPGDPTMEAIGHAHGKGAAQVALRWLLQQANVAPIPRSGSPEHRRANFEVFDFALAEDEMARISALADDPD